MSRQHRSRTTAAIGAVTALLGALVAVALPSGAASAVGSTLLDESFTGSSVAAPAALALGQACLTGAAIPSTPPAGASNLSNCLGRTSGSPTPGATPGWLQLTDVSLHSTGGMVYNAGVPSSQGLQVEFDQAQYGGTGGGADGIGFFLVDGAFNLTSTGGPGSQLGYIGVDGGYIGVGLDVFGGSGRLPTTGCAAPPYTQYIKNIVTLRGPGNAGTGYCLLSATATAPTGPSTLPGDLSGTTPRNVRVTVSPGTFPVITVEIDFTGTRTDFQPILSYAMTDPAPATYKFGFSGSTGSSTDVHLIRNTTVRTIDPLPPLDLVKQVDQTNPQPASYALGDTIPYTFLVTNTTAAGMTGVSVDDPMLTNVVCPKDTLGPGGTAAAAMTCTGSHVVTGTDVQSSTLANTATATGTEVGAGTVTATDSVTVPITTAIASLSLVKSAQLADTNGNGLADVGERIGYRFAVENTGSTPLSSPSIADPKAGPVTCPAAPFAPGATVTCTADAPYTVTDADVVAGGAINTATATAVPPNGLPAPTATGTVDTPTPAAAAGLALTKTATLNDGNGNGLADPGETIDYSFALRNTGTVTLTGVAVSDPRAGAVSCPATSLAPDAAMTCTADAAYPVTQADIVAGGVTNTATATGTPPAGVPPITDPTDTVDTPTAVAGPGLHLTKTATLTDANGDGLADVGETIRYAFTLLNTGNITLTGVSVADPKAGPVTCAATTVAPGQTTTCTAAPYRVTDADVLAGGVTNTATASANPPVGGATDTVVTPTPAASTGIALDKTATLADANGNGVADIGESIAWGLTVTNRGSLTLSDPAVSDPTAGAVHCPAGALAPAATLTCTVAAHTVTEADVLAGAVTNTATVDATVPAGAAALVPATDSARVPTAIAHAALAMTAQATLQDANGNGLADPGETIAYALRVTNTGNVTLDQLAIDAHLSGAMVGAVTCPTTTLAPGASVTCTTSHAVTALDQAIGNVAFDAEANGTAPAGVPAPLPAVAQASTATAPLPPAPGGGGSADGGGTPQPPAVESSSGGASDLADTGSRSLGLGILLGCGALVLGGVAAMRPWRRSHRG